MKKCKYFAIFSKFFHSNLPLKGGWMILILSSLICIQNSEASTDFKTIDSETYRLFTEQKWDSVIIVGKRALKENVDYFYLRLRIGISYFEIQKYISAIEHLRRAHEFNSMDPMTMEYLYESLLRSGRLIEARAMYDEMPPMLKENLKLQKKFLDNAHIEGGYTFSSDNKKQTNPYLMGPDSLYGEMDLYGDHYYTNVDLTLNLTPKINLTLAYNYLNFSKWKYFQYGYYQDQLDSTTQYWWGYENHYSWHRKVSSYDVRYNVHQHELYLGSVFQLPAGIKLMPAFHLIYITYPETSAMYHEKMITDTLFVDSITPNSEIYTFAQGSYSYNVQNKRIANFLISLMLTKDFSVFSSGLAGSYSNLNNMAQSQLTWSLAYYPWGKTNFYGNTSVIARFQEDKSGIIFQQVIGGKIYKGLWVEGSVIIGDLTNANLLNGFIIYNTTDKTNYRLGANLTYSLSKNLGISLIYQYFSNESSHFYYVSDYSDPLQPTMKPVTQYNNYKTNTIIGGITWKF